MKAPTTRLAVIALSLALVGSMALTTRADSGNQQQQQQQPMGGCCGSSQGGQ